MSNTCTLYKFFVPQDNNIRTIVIPYYQRGFKSTEQQWRLLETQVLDIQQLIIPMYFCDVNNRREIIDGGQRTVTMYIAMLMFQKVLNNKNLSGGRENFFILPSTYFQSNPKSIKLVLKNLNDVCALESVEKFYVGKGKLLSNSLIEKCAKYFFNMANKFPESGAGSIVEFFTSLYSMSIDYYSKSDKESVKYFTIINSGTALTHEEHGCGVVLKIAQSKGYEKRSIEIIEKFNKINAKQQPEFWQAFWVSEGFCLNKPDPLKLGEKLEVMSERKFEKTLDNLELSIFLYECIDNPENYKNKSIAHPIRKFLDDLKRISVKVRPYLSFVLFVLRHFYHNEENFSKLKFNIFKIIKRILFFASITNRSRNVAQSIFANSLIEFENTQPEFDEIFSLIEKQETKLFKKYTLTKDKILEKYNDVPFDQDSFFKMILLETYGNNIDAKATLEHICPIKFKNTKEVGSWVESVGNLVYIDGLLNSILQDRDFETKKKSYPLLYSDVICLDKWGVEEIKTRQHNLLEKFIDSLYDN